jgi:hypothetical protein
MTLQDPVCLYCQRTSDQAPLISMIYRGAPVWICPQHLPILIHKPALLADMLPGIEGLQPAEGHEHE